MSLLLVLSGIAQAQDADTFSFSGSALDQQGGFQLSHPTLGEDGDWYAMLGFVYADDPLVIRYVDGTEESVVSRQMSFRLHGGYNVKNVARVEAELPLYPSVVVNGQGQFAMGDLTLSGLFPVASFGDSADSVGVALRPRVILPTGRNAGAFTSRETIGGGLTAVVGGAAAASRLGYRVNLGLDFGPKATFEDLDFGTSFDAGAGLDYKVQEDILVGAELTSRVTLSGGTAWNKNPIEGHVYGGYQHESGFNALLGLGTGLLAGVGAPDYRLALALGYRPSGPKDTDGDGITDDLDGCIEVPEDFDGFKDRDGCPELDNDGDGLVDAEDECPISAEDLDGFQDSDGCPDPDNDGDGIPDGGDDCPLVPGLPEHNGCPDKDGDGVVDDMDQCPDEPGPLETSGCPDADEDRVPDFRDECPDEAIAEEADPRRSNGCPTKVIVTKESIVIVDKVYFRTAKSTIKTVSYPILNEVAEVLLANPDITSVEVAGHTDSDGSDAANLKLSQARAESVVKYLVGKGVDESRLIAKGYGEGTPIDTNDTSAGKANNRRVEFVILEQGSPD